MWRCRFLIFAVGFIDDLEVVDEFSGPSLDPVLPRSWSIHLFSGGVSTTFQKSNRASQGISLFLALSFGVPRCFPGGLFRDWFHNLPRLFQPGCIISTRTMNHTSWTIQPHRALPKRQLIYPTHLIYDAPVIVGFVAKHNRSNTGRIIYVRAVNEIQFKCWSSLKLLSYPRSTL